MPKKQKQKQKQKQSQKTSVVVNVGASKKGVSRRPKTAPTPPQKNPQSISVTLQGSSMNLPAPLTNDYNKILQQLDFIRREQAQAGSLISNMGRNDLLNRVQAHNPFSVASTNTQSAMLDPYEGEMEEVVESSTTQNSYDNNTYNAKIPIDQDFIRQARINRFEQTLGGNTYKIGVGDVETVSDLSAYDDEDFEDRLAESVKDNALVEKVKMMSEDEYFDFIPAPKRRTDMYARKLPEKGSSGNSSDEYFNLIPAPKRRTDMYARKEEEGYLEEPSKKEKALTSRLVDSTDKFIPTQKPKGRPAISEEEKKERKKEYQRNYYKKKKAEQFKL